VGTGSDGLLHCHPSLPRKRFTAKPTTERR
jgi:hypothetical protein